MRIDFNIDAARGAIIQRDLARLSGPEIVRALNDMGNYKVSQLVRAFIRGTGTTKWGTPAGSPAGGPPAMHSGQLRASITYAIVGKALIVGTNKIYALMQHLGGTIRPKPPKKFLTIPADPAAYGHRARDFRNTFFAKGAIFQTIGRGQIRRLFFLRKEVILPPRPWLLWIEADRVKLMAILARAVGLHP